jgi:hypothetical protein
LITIIQQQMAANVLVLGQIQLLVLSVCFCWLLDFANHAHALLNVALALPLCALLLLLLVLLPLCALLLLLLVLLLLPAFIHVRTCSAERIQVLNRSSARGSV